MALTMNGSAQRFEHFAHDDDIRNKRDIMNGAFALAQKRRGDELERRVLRARYAHRTRKVFAFANDDYFFRHTPFLRSIFFSHYLLPE